MAKPDDIPQDVWEAAVAIWDGPEHFHSSEYETIARAILAERERCADIAVKRADHHRDHCEPDCKCANGWHIAMEIRKPVP